jgi:DNA-binding response OmpR family regulator
MQSLLLAEDLHQGQFVQQGFKYESVPTHLLSIHAAPDDLTEQVFSCDSVFLLLHRLDLMDVILPLLRQHNRSIPIIVLSQQYSPKLLEYVKSQKIYHFYTRPFSFRLIANEVRALVYKQREQSTYQILRVRDLELNRDTHEVRWKGQFIQLRHKEFILLEFLMLNAGKLMTREIILESVWDRNANIFTNTVDVHINKLRKKIDYNVSEKYIHTVHCSGYIFS